MHNEHNTRRKSALVILLTGILLALHGSEAVGQLNPSGRIVGTVIDSETGEAVIGANVMIERTTRGAASDIEGKFVIGDVDPGRYAILTSALGYGKKRIADLDVRPGQTVRLSIVLVPEAIQFDVVEVQAKAVTSHEGALLTRQRKAASVSDGISAEQIKRAPDATSVDALKRVTGMSIVDNRFVYVRGTSERYSAARLNGTALASSEPDKKAFAFDLFPSNLIDNVVVSKTFTPDVPGDLSGGLVDMKTIDFPPSLTVRLSIAPSFNSSATGKSFSTYDGGSSDVLALDDGTRQIPDGFPSDLNAQQYSESELQQYGRLLKNVWGTKSKTAPFNGSYSLSIGDGATLLGNNFGFVASFSYRNGFSVSDIERNDYELAGPKFEFKGRQNTFSVLWGGLLNFSYKLSDQHKLTISNVYNRSADDDVVLLQGTDYLRAFDTKSTLLRFVSRSVYSGQLTGEHFFQGLGGVQLEWRAAFSEAVREEPDYRRTSYVRDQGSSDPYRILINVQPDPQNGGRFYSELYDRSRSVGADFTVPFSLLKVKVGALFERKDRDFDSRLLGFIATTRTDLQLYYLDINTIFAPENIGPRGFKISEYSSGTNRYDARQNLSAGYLMLDEPFSVFGQKLRFIGGVRVERSRQQLHSMNFAGTLPINSDLVTTNLLPSVNLTYFLNEVTNLRIAFSQTVNRPEFRELAPFAYYDFSTGTTVYGNPHLKHSLIRNYDLRLETFPDGGEIASVSFFYKDFTNAIEQVVVPGNSLGAERTFANAKAGTNYGVEFELRKSLGFLHEGLSNFSITANYTRIKSDVDISGSALAYARSNRPLQGQSPYSINAGLNYINVSTGTSVSILFNRIGARIVEVATIYDEDVVELPRDIVDFTIAQTVFRNFELKASAKDILAKKQIFAQGDKIARSNSKSSTFSLGLSMKL